MKAKSTGGAAFPTTPDNEKNRAGRGMSLRDWFAGMALQSLIARAPKESFTSSWHDRVAAEAYEVADAMLRGRDK